MMPVAEMSEPVLGGAGALGPTESEAKKIKKYPFVLPNLGKYRDSQAFWTHKVSEKFMHNYWEKINPNYKYYLKMAQIA
jgi:hypothetical protein